MTQIRALETNKQKNCFIKNTTQVTNSCAKRVNVRA